MFKTVVRRSIKVGDVITIIKGGFEYSGSVVSIEISNKDPHIVLDNGEGNFHLISLDTDSVITVENPIINPNTGDEIKAKKKRK